MERFLPISVVSESDLQVIPNPLFDLGPCALFPNSGSTHGENRLVQAAALDKCAEQAPNLDRIRESIEDAGSVGAVLWSAFVATSLYIAIAATAVTHETLLQSDSATLPLLRAQVPLVAFFTLAPAILIALHAYMLLHLQLMAARINIFNAELDRRFPGEAVDEVERLRLQLPSNIFVQFFAGPKNTRTGWVGLLLVLIVWFSIVIAPFLLLFLIQAVFVPYHDEAVTWWQRIAIVADVALLWSIWPAVLRTRDQTAGSRSWWPKPLLLLASLIAIWLAFLTATFPGERMYDLFGPNTGRQRWLKDIGVPSAHNFLFEAPIKGDFRGRRHGPFSATLVLVDALEKETKESDLTHTLSLRGRDLQGAIFNGSFLLKVDLTGAQLQNASLEETNLHCAALEKANLRRAWLRKASLKCASFKGAQIQGANLELVDAEDATFDDAHLEGTSFDGADLRNASFQNAHLEGASLRGAKLNGARFKGAHLEGATFLGADGKADFNGAYGWRTNWDNFPHRGVEEKRLSKEEFEKLKEDLQTEGPEALSRIDVLDPEKPEATIRQMSGRR